MVASVNRISKGGHRDGTKNELPNWESIIVNNVTQSKCGKQGILPNFLNFPIFRQKSFPAYPDWDCISVSRLLGMSFQHFRLGEMAMANPPPHLMHLHGSVTNIHGHPQQSQQSSQFTTIDNTNNSFSNNTSKISPGSSNKQPYGSGDTDDGYTLVFPNLAAFNEWREREEENQVVEFVKVLHISIMHPHLLTSFWF